MAVIEGVIENRVRQAALELSRSSAVVALYIFGSQINGRADEWSDVDIGAFVEGAEAWDLDRWTKVTVDLQEQFGNDLEFHFFPACKFQNPEPGSFAEFVKENGLRIDFTSGT